MQPGGARALVLDVGANFGYFALGAAAAGCRVIAWEPIQLFRAFLHHGIALNHLTHLIRVRFRMCPSCRVCPSCRAAPSPLVGGRGFGGASAALIAS